MDAREAYAYALLRVVPSLERGESINVGIVFFCRRCDFLDVRWAVREELACALAPGLDLKPVESALRMLAAIAAGDSSGGPVAAQEQSERFHWLVAPTSTLIQPGPVHTGLTDSPSATLERLFAELIA